MSTLSRRELAIRNSREQLVDVPFIPNMINDPLKRVFTKAAAEEWYKVYPRSAAVTIQPDAQIDNTPIRMRFALLMLREFGGIGAAYDSLVVLKVTEWIDGGMQGPVPWPDSPFFSEWAKEKGWTNVDGFVGFRFTVSLETP